MQERVTFLSWEQSFADFVNLPEDTEKNVYDDTRVETLRRILASIPDDIRQDGFIRNNAISTGAVFIDAIPLCSIDVLWEMYLKHVIPKINSDLLEDIAILSRQEGSMLPTLVNKKGIVETINSFPNYFPRCNTFEDALPLIAAYDAFSLRDDVVRRGLLSGFPLIDSAIFANLEVTGKELSRKTAGAHGIHWTTFGDFEETTQRTQEIKQSIEQTGLHDLFRSFSFTRFRSYM